MSDGSSSNFPPPSGVADEIIVEAIKCIDADVWDAISDYSITIRTVRIHHSDATIVISTGDVSILNYGKPSVAYRDAFRETFARALERVREQRMKPLLATIADGDTEARNARKRRRDDRLSLVAFVVGIGIIGWGGLSIASCGVQEQQAEAARDGEVNKYGFKRGAITSRKVWPDDCAGSGIQFNNDPSTGRDFHSVYECKQSWERWERDGKIWVDWKAEQ